MFNTRLVIKCCRFLVMTKIPLISLGSSSSESYRSSSEAQNDLVKTKDALCKSVDMTEQLRLSLSNLALEKQTLVGQMQRCQASNGKLIQQLAMEKADFQARTQRMQHEISVIRSNVVAAKSDIVLANKEMRENLTSAVRTTMRLSLMFLRMREAKRRAERRSHYHRQLCQDFIGTIHEQTNIIQQHTRRHQCSNNAEEESTTVDDLLFNAQKRIGQLLEQNASLQIRLTSEQFRSHSGRRQTRRSTRRLLRGLAKELLFESGRLSEAARHTEFVFGRQKISRQLHAHLVSDPDVTIFDVGKIAK